MIMKTKLTKYYNYKQGVHSLTLILVFNVLPPIQNTQRHHIVSILLV